MPAFVAAVEAGYGIELDVQLSADGKLIVMHDAELRRMTGARGTVKQWHSAQLRRLTVGASESAVQSLDEVLEMVDGRVPVLIEVKPCNSVIAAGKELARTARTYPGPVAVQAFDPRMLLWLRMRLPGMMRGQLSGSFYGIGLHRSLIFLLRGMFLNALTAPDFLAFEVEAMPSRFVALWRKALRAPLLLWTVRSVEQLDFARRCGANVIFEGFLPQPK